MSTSALEAWGVDEVKRWMLARLPEGPTLYPKAQVTEHPERFFVSEIVREHVFEQYDQEIPYAVQARALLRCACPARLLTLQPALPRGLFAPAP